MTDYNDVYTSTLAERYYHVLFCNCYYLHSTTTTAILLTTAMITYYKYSMSWRNNYVRLQSNTHSHTHTHTTHTHIHTRLVPL